MLPDSQNRRDWRKELNDLRKENLDLRIANEDLRGYVGLLEHKMALAREALAMTIKETPPCDRNT